MIGLLAVHVHMLEADAAAHLDREQVVLDLDLLHAQHVRVELGHDPLQAGGAQPD